MTACAGAGRFASLALATEDPRPDLLLRRPYPRDQPLLSAVMLRSMVCHSAWQILLLFALIFAVGDMCEAPGEGARCVGRAAHDALSMGKTAHVMNNEMQRKYLQSVKRLIAFEQRCIDHLRTWSPSRGRELNPCGICPRSACIFHKTVRGRKRVQQSCLGSMLQRQLTCSSTTKAMKSRLRTSTVVGPLRKCDGTERVT